MQVVSSTEFATHYDKYLNMAVSHDVRIKKGQQMFRITYEPVVEESVIFEPDEDFYNSISMDVVRERLHKVVDKLYAK
jgi:hypothetical protein